jgi:hypothetical protein
MDAREWLFYESRYQDSDGRHWVKLRLDEGHEPGRVIQIEATDLDEAVTLESRARKQLEIPDSDTVLFTAERRS